MGAALVHRGGQGLKNPAVTALRRNSSTIPDMTPAAIPRPSIRPDEPLGSRRRKVDPDQKASVEIGGRIGDRALGGGQ